MKARTLVITAILLLVAFIGLFAGYFFGAETARNRNAADMTMLEAGV